MIVHPVMNDCKEGKSVGSLVIRDKSRRLLQLHPEISITNK